MRHPTGELIKAPLFMSFILFLFGDFRFILMEGQKEGGGDRNHLVLFAFRFVPLFLSSPEGGGERGRKCRSKEMAKWEERERGKAPNPQNAECGGETKDTHTHACGRTQLQRRGEQ